MRSQLRSPGTRIANAGRQTQRQQLPPAGSAEGGEREGGDMQEHRRSHRAAQRRCPTRSRAATRARSAAPAASSQIGRPAHSCGAVEVARVLCPSPALWSPGRRGRAGGFLLVATPALLPQGHRRESYARRGPAPSALQGPTTAAALFTRNNNRGSNHATAGKQARAGNHLAQLRSLTLSQARPTSSLNNSRQTPTQFFL
jgi:hypothetical protein